MTSDGLDDVFTSTKEILRNAGVDDDFFLDLVASRLLVERVGESDNLDWWDSRVLTETGRTRLSEVTPKTHLKSRITLAMKVGRKVETDRLPDDSVSLFNFGPQIESRVTAAIEEITTDEDQPLAPLENISIRSPAEGWTDPMIEGFASAGAGDFASESIQDPGSVETILIDEHGYTQDEVESEKWQLLTMLLRGYGSCTDRLRIPFYALEPDLKSENAG